MKENPPKDDDERKRNFLFLKEKKGEQMRGTMTTRGVLAETSETSWNVSGNRQNVKLNIVKIDALPKKINR